jgi:cbb3-type cytochrome oxidase subunit 3
VTGQGARPAEDNDVRLSDIMANAGLAGYAEIALLIFMAVFVAVVLRIFWPGRKAELEQAARMPLDDEHVVTPRKDTDR